MLELDLIQEHERCQVSWSEHPSNTLQFHIYLFNPFAVYVQLLLGIFKDWDAVVEKPE